MSRSLKLRLVQSKCRYACAKKASYPCIQLGRIVLLFSCRSQELFEGGIRLLSCCCFAPLDAAKFCQLFLLSLSIGEEEGKQGSGFLSVWHVHSHRGKGWIYPGRQHLLINWPFNFLCLELRRWASYASTIKKSRICVRRALTTYSNLDGKLFSTQELSRLVHIE